ncbi:cupin domain-containing protein [Streptomyces orinoci]|uniref:Cupin domain-containing protein n=1 Tax=Streptomyces orinoci TaxID=67339 RepID=A0ABV3JZR5_STRON|nr:cupin domain-containing protein [Streptomyces orinoci]
MTLLADQGEAAPRAQPCADLSRLIRPFTLDTFRREHWERRPLLVRRHDPLYFAELLTLEDVDTALSLSGGRLDGLRVVLDGKETRLASLAASRGPNGSVNALEELYACYRNGSTVVLNALEQWNPRLQRLADALGTELSARIQANVYVTPPGARGFVPHYDTHDVFVAQIHGTKRWQLASQPHELPMKNEPYDKSRPEPAVEQEFDLEPGDLLYLPRGAVHSATSNETVSVHVTLGVHPLLYGEVIEHALRRLFSRDVRFRRGLPMGFASDAEARREVERTVAELLATLPTALSPADIADESVTRAVSIATPVLHGHLADLDSLAGLGLTTPLRVRTGLRWNLTVTGDTVALEFHNKAVRMPAAVAEEVCYVAERGPAAFTADAIPGDLDGPGRLTLVRALLREGFLTFG